MAAGVRGAEAHIRRLQRIRGPAMVRAVTAEIFAAAQDIANDAALSIERGSVSGKEHVASAPGEPPNADTQVLSRNIEAAVVGPLKAEVSSNAPYALPQEFGSPSRNLAERPYMRPAAERGREPTARRVIAAVRRVTR